MVNELYQVLLPQFYSIHVRHFLVVEVQTDVARMFLAVVEWSFNSSSTTWRISGTSYLVFKLEGDRQPIGKLLVDSLL